MRVLIYERRVLWRDALVAMTRAAGMSLGQSTLDERQLYEVLGEVTPTLLLLGLAVPDLEPGLALVRDLRRFHPQVSTVVLVGTPSDLQLREWERSGAAGLVDVDRRTADELLVCLATVASGRRAFQRGEGEEDLPRPRGSSRLERLSDRERQVLHELAAGADNLKIAALLEITERTVKAHVSSLYRKLACENRIEVALFAWKSGYVKDPPPPPNRAPATER